MVGSLGLKGFELEPQKLAFASLMAAVALLRATQ